MVVFILQQAQKLLSLYIVILCFLTLFVTDAHAWLDGYSHRKEITIQADNIDSDLTDFPLHISIASDTDIESGMKDKTNYYDIRFTNTSDTILPYEEEAMSISGGSATGDYWVQIDLDDTTGATIYVYYGKAGATDGSDPTAVWNSGFVGVWHLSEGTSTEVDFFKDSTSNNNDGTLTDSDGDVSQIDASVGKGVYFTGTDGETDRINVGNDSSLDLGSTFTLSGWVNVDNHNSRDGGYGFMISKDEYPNGGSYDLGFRNNKPYVAINTNPTGAAWGIYSRDSDLPTDDWYHFASVRDSDDSLVLYLDGAAPKNFAGVNSPTTSTTDVTFGLRSVDTLELNGSLDELRIENVARSAEWIKFMYANSGGQSDNELSWSAQRSQITPSPSGSTSSSTPGGTTNPHHCSDLAPVEELDLFQIDRSKTSATIYFTPTINSDWYFISYSAQSHAEEHGAYIKLSREGVQQFSIRALRPNLEYYFKVRGQNGCMPGNWSNVLKSNAAQGASYRYH